MRFFPYDAPYDNQQEAMDRIYNGLSRGQDVLFEGACGTGKTLSSLVPALEFAREEDKTVVITTNVHQQMRQFVTEAREITRKEPLRAVVFRGKGSMCHIDVDYQECQVLRDNTYEVVDKERDKQELEQRQSELLSDMQEGDSTAAEARSAVMDELDQIQDEVENLKEKNVCEHYYNNLTGNTEEFYQWLYDGVRTPDDIYEYAEQQGMCGYELLKDGMEGVDLVVCNYHHLLDPMIREQFFRWLGRDPEDVITIFDEAHNIEGTARDHASRTLTENTIDSALDELQESDDFRSEAGFNVLAAFQRALKATYEDSFGFGEREAVGENWQDVAVANENKRDDLTLELPAGVLRDGNRRRVGRRALARQGTRPEVRGRVQGGRRDDAKGVPDVAGRARSSNPTWTRGPNSASIPSSRFDATRGRTKCTDGRSCTPASRAR